MWLLEILATCLCSSLDDENDLLEVQFIDF